MLTLIDYEDVIVVCHHPKDVPLAHQVENLALVTLIFGHKLKGFRVPLRIWKVRHHVGGGIGRTLGTIKLMTFDEYRTNSLQQWLPEIDGFGRANRYLVRKNYRVVRFFQNRYLHLWK
jgi:hypothetical protein